MRQVGRDRVDWLRLLSLPKFTVPLSRRLEGPCVFGWSPDPGPGSSGRAALESGVI